ncbi:hypothetical protein GA0115240_147026 [Streptomyces sp. DvalAA-14]|uniref:N,N-dimethylformamidase beta subunit family domain-containing protein n=1 Tax=Streptomyces sp. SID4948 TaxID=2690287 RepID=UPI00081B69B5|nr:hypothetical protein GA0115240_147026 [Streptomyces sp. DvalAA-14]
MGDGGTGRETGGERGEPGGGESGGGEGEARGGGPLGRRHFLGAVAAGAAATAVGAVAGCDAGGDGRGATPSSPPSGGTWERADDADWRLRSTGPAGAVQGYTDKASVLPGEEFTLHVSTTASVLRVSAYRVGWYGGAQARRVWSSGRVAGRAQSRPQLFVPTRTIRADWEPTLRIRTDGWPEGAYLLRLDADNGHQRYVPLIVRSASGAGKTVLMHAPTTWQAYNLWGGYSLYKGQGGAYAYRSTAVTFDRPYDRSGAEKFLVYERAVVVLAERLGIPLAYTTGLDVHRSPGVLRGATTAVALGHDEYWTPEQRRHVTAARDAGTNLAFLGANTCFRRVRLEPGPGGPARTVVCYKNDFAADPYLADHPTMATTDFRSHPAADPESSLTGVIYDGFPTDAAYTVERPDHWLFAGTGVGRGESFDHLVGVEYDRVVPHFPAPAPIEIVAHSRLECDGRAGHSDSAYYAVPGGAGGLRHRDDAVGRGTDGGYPGRRAGPRHGRADPAFRHAHDRESAPGVRRGPGGDPAAGPARQRAAPLSGLTARRPAGRRFGASGAGASVGLARPERHPAEGLHQDGQCSGGHALVAEVEDAGVADLDEVQDGAAAESGGAEEAVGEVAARAGEDQPESDSPAGGPQGRRRADDEGEYADGQRGEDEGGVRGEGAGRTGVAEGGEGQRAAQEAHRRVTLDGHRGDGLGHLVHREPGRGRRPQHPLRRSHARHRPPSARSMTTQ